jgi:hypothetical protein
MTGEARERSFDELARGLASGDMSRRRAIKLMGGVLVGGTLASLGLGGVAAADEECKPLTRKCRKNEQCCSGNCSKSGTSRSGTCACQENGGSCANNSQCCSGICASGTCAAACVANGGSCTSGSECCSGNCKSGTCVASCIPPSATPCDPTDPSACGPRPGCVCNDEVSGGAYCGGGGGTTVCTTSCDCPTGQFCPLGAPNSSCVDAC